jgi:hypothetical protein
VAILFLGGYKYRDLALEVGRERSIVMGPAGLGPENDFAGEDLRTKLRGLSPRANYTDRAAGARQRI